MMAQLIAQGSDNIDLSVGAPDFPTQEHVNRTGIDAIIQKQTSVNDFSLYPVVSTNLSKRFQARKLRVLYAGWMGNMLSPDTKENSN